MHKLDATQFVFTGQLTSMSRNEANAAVRDAGGTVAGQITPDTDFLVAGPDAVLSKRKLAQAELLGAKVIGEAEFLRMIEDNGI